MNCYTYKQLEVPGTHQSIPSIIPRATAHEHRPVSGGSTSLGGNTEEKSEVKVNTKEEKKVIKIISVFIYLIREH